MTAPKVETSADSASYALGMFLAQQIEQSKMTEGINEKIVGAALKKSMEGEDSTIFQHPQQAMMYLQMYAQQKMMESQQGNIEEGEKFLEENAKKDGVIELESGLQYKIIEEGAGAMPLATDQVTCHYKGTTIDGKEFDSSYKRGQPATFPLNGVIKGWTEGFQKMKAGSKFELYIPYQLAYGERGSGSIPPYAALIFEVEFLEIVAQ
jgi:FKBP-type peptidyl-prolyl cis-trans isomerase FklB